MYQQTVDQAGLAGDKFLLSRVYHEMGVMLAETGELDQALITMRQAAVISRESGYAAGLAHSLIGLSYLYTRLGQIDEARIALREAMEWLQMLEDKAGLQFVTDRMARLNDNPDEMEEPPSQMGWVRTYVTLGEGKVYCEYESPLARA
jgi:tetratricopeptide (TPR) repeat protein